MKEQVSAGIFKVMAVISALAIGGGYVAWRQDEADKENKRERVEQAKAEEAKEEEEIDLMPGSKSAGGKVMTSEEIEVYLKKGQDFIHPIPGVLDGSEDGSNTASLLPGSKSISMPLFTKDQIKELQGKDPKEVEIAPEDLHPGSKIGILRLREKDAEPPEEKEPELLPGSKSGIFIPKEPEPEKSK